MVKSVLPAFVEYFVPTVKALKARGGSATIEEMEEAVAELMGLSDEARTEPHGDTGKTQFQYELAWVRTYLKKVGAADNSSRGVWSLTEKGEHLSDEEVRGVVHSVRAEKRKPKALASKKVPALPEEDEEEGDWSAELLAILGDIAPDAFERLCQRMLREAGFTKVDVTGRSGDGGIDGIGVLRVNLVSFQVLFQCKRWKSSIGAGVVRDFRGAMVGRADKGLIITTATFTPDARREATRDGAPAIDLVDGETLCGLLKDLKLGVSVRLVEEVTVEPEFFKGI
ncbi:MAG: restriction endonuclease [Siculibacillus sp.]|nr:restriction endonuclease [Siculibacillus sp.]